MSATSSDAIDLSRALSRLESKILTSPPARLRCSAPERQKTRANLEHARTLLLRLEHASAQHKAARRGGGAAAQLARQRALVKRLTERLHDLDTADEGGYAGLDEEEDALKMLAALPAPARAAGHSAPAEQAAATQVPAPRPAAAPVPDTSSVLRSRDPRAALLGPASSTTAHGLAAAPTTREKGAPAAKVLEAADGAHAELTASMLGLAAALKEGARAFAADLDADARSLTRAGSALDRTGGGLDVTSKGLGALRRMGEGRWWMGRMVLMAAIVGLWVVLLLFVFVGPKLRWG